MKRRKRAVALQYQKEDEAPRIVAKGRDNLAERILGIAREHGVYIEHDSVLAETLMRFEIGDYIPEEVYEIVAQILAFVYSLNSGNDNGNEKDQGG